MGGINIDSVIPYILSMRIPRMETADSMWQIIITAILTLFIVGDEDEEDLELFGDNVDMNESLSSV